jgi:hypothetical protein
VISYIRGMKRYFWLIGLFVILAQESWAIVVSDTLIIDGETIYIEERQTPISDSLSNSRKNDFKEKKKPVIWGLDGAFGMQMADFSISNFNNQELVSVNGFSGISNSTFYHSGFSLGGYLRVHRNIEIGTSINIFGGGVSESTAVVNTSSTSVSFYLDEDRIQHVFQTEVQPQVFELDTANVNTFSNVFNLSSFQIPLKFRFYVNEFTTKSKWKAYGEISPVYRSFKLKSNSSEVPQMLFINASGNFEYLNLIEQRFQTFGVLVGAGSEFQLTKRFNAFVQANWSFPPVNSSDSNGANYFAQYSNVSLGIRVLINEGK